MKYAHISYVSKPVSRIVLGSAGKQFTSGGDVNEVMETALDSGINSNEPPYIAVLSLIFPFSATFITIM